jgi:hypothetical protein
MKNHLTRKIALLILPVLLLGSVALYAQTTITIVNGNEAGVGFNDPTPAAPIGGNPGTTLGEQRLFAFQHAANIWGSQLASNVEIKILATFEPLSCTATSAVLGSAGTMFIFSDFPYVDPSPGPEFPSTWYHSALAKKRAGYDFAPYDPSYGEADLRARFNSNLGLTGCLTGSGWYLGIDGNHGGLIDLVTVLLHEFAHGLGFSQFASVSSGSQIMDQTDIYGRHLLDLTANKTWDQMTNAERAASAINTQKVVWAGSNVTGSLPAVLASGTPLLRVSSPAGIAGSYMVGPAAFGPALSSPGVSGAIVQALDPADASGPSTYDACSPLTNARALAGRIALVDRGTCGFVVKVKNAQNAGAIAVLVADNAAGSPPPGLGGADSTIVIPSARITLADANIIKAQLASRVYVTLGIDHRVRAGADANGRALLYTPNPVQPGSTISHFDTSAFPNQLMEPAINADLTHNVDLPNDLTMSLLKDIGWFPDADLDGAADSTDCEAHSDFSSTVAIAGCDSGVQNTFFLNGCTISDYISHLSASSKDHARFVVSVTRFLNELIEAGIITADQKGAIKSCADGPAIP